MVNTQPQQCRVEGDSGCSRVWATVAVAGWGGQVSKPQLIGGLVGRAIVAVAAGAGHSVAVSARGELWCWGVAAKGQCGVQSVQQVLHAYNCATLTVPLVLMSRF